MTLGSNSPELFPTVANVQYITHQAVMTWNAAATGLVRSSSRMAMTDSRGKQTYQAMGRQAAQLRPE